VRDLNNVAPRVGFNWKASGDDDFVIRGGTGLFYSIVGSAHDVDQQLWNGQRVIVNSYPNDGKPGFIQDPSRGVTADDILSGRVPPAPQALKGVISEQMRMPVTWQSIIGFQKQLGTVTAFDADMTYWRGSDEESGREANVFYDPVTGYNKNPAQFGRPNQNYGPIGMDESNGHSDYLALATSFTRRYQKNFQIGLTYTAMFFKNDTLRRYSGAGPSQLNPFDIEVDWGRSNDFQRHTLRANGIWKLPLEMTVAAFYSYGSGNYLQVTSGFDPTGGGFNRLRRDLSLIPRNTFTGDPRQTLDLRVSKELHLAGHMRIQGIAELFNVFNYGSFGYNTLETSRLYGTSNRALSRPRSGQLAFRLLF
jgi:hypothetical protein